MKTKGLDRIIEIVNYMVLIAIGIVCIYPFYYIFIYSISVPGAIANGGGYLWPVGFSLLNFQKLLVDPHIFQAILVSVARTVVGSILTVICCTLFSYLLTKDRLPFRSLIYRFVVITLYLQVGLIPYFIVMKNLGLTNTFLIYVLPSSISGFFIVLTKTYIEQLPASVEESAMIDGAGYWVVFTKIIFPLSMPIIATVTIYAATYQWNSWQDNYFFVNSSSLRVLQMVLYDYLTNAQQVANNASDTLKSIHGSMLQPTPMSIRMTMSVITLLPIMLVYPFLQKFFVKGILIGAVKG